jgi:hypothetical protein
MSDNNRIYQKPVFLVSTYFWKHKLKTKNKNLKVTNVAWKTCYIWSPKTKLLTNLIIKPIIIRSIPDTRFQLMNQHFLYQFVGWDHGNFTVNFYWTLHSVLWVTWLYVKALWHSKFRANSTVGKLTKSIFQI